MSRFARLSAFILVYPRLSAFIRVYPRLSVFIRIYPSVPDICGLRAARRRDIEGDRNFYPRNPILLSILSHNNLIYPGFDFWIYFDAPSGGCTTDGEEGPDYECDEGMIVNEECPAAIEGLYIAHRFDSGWSGVLGKVLRKVTLSIEAPEDNGRYATKYPDSRKEYVHDLFAEDYGINKMWVVVRPCAS